MHGMTRQLRQRADYTHKFNVRTGRHGWLRLTPAYSVKVVQEIIERYGSSLSILDPFCGTGTTALSAVSRGLDAATTDINPFLIWLATAKTAHYATSEIAQADKAGKAALDLARRGVVELAAEPPIHNIERWWSNGARHFLCQLKSAIETVENRAGPVVDLLHVAFCRTLIKLSAAAFNHQSMSFKEGAQCSFDLNPDAGEVFLDDLAFVLVGAKENPLGIAKIVLGDARNLSGCFRDKFDVVVTSPPYANRMSYIRELRPYMYWLGYLKNGRDASELDWLAIGGTWGIATSRLAEWSSNENCWTPNDLPATLKDIANGDNKNGEILSKYVAKYCEDMSTHFESLRHVLNPGARVHYIVGNSTFYGVLVSTEQSYAAMLLKYGFTDVDVRAIRKRNSKKELLEFDVSATWCG